MKLVIIESPYAGEVAKNSAYLNKALNDCLTRGEAPFASHGLYPNCLNDQLPEERELGISAGFAWGAKADLIAFYVDYGWSRGMETALEFYSRLNIPYEVRRLYQESWRPDAAATRDDVARTLGSTPTT